MLKEIGIILGAMGCILLWIPLCLFFPSHFELVLVISLFLLSAVLVYAAFDVKKLVGNNQRKKAGAFVIILLTVIIVLSTAAVLITSYLYLQLHPPFF